VARLFLDLTASLVERSQAFSFFSFTLGFFPCLTPGSRFSLDGDLVNRRSG
jgi:hypothetical protein